MSPLDFVTLVLAILVLILLQVPILLGTMYAQHHYLEPTDYGDFNFDTFTQEAFQKFVLKFALPLVAVPAFLLSFLGWVMRLWLATLMRPSFGSFTTGLILTVLQFGAIYAGMNFMLHLDLKKSSIIAGANALVYILLYVLIVSWVIR